MQSLDNIVVQYLMMKTNNALLISGEWGSGKTHYYKRSLSKKIVEISLVNNEERKYKPVLVSLFGLKSIEDIKEQILISLYPILKNKVLKIGFGIGKSFAKVLSKLKGLDSVYDVVEDISIDKGILIDFNDLVICFDDLERVSKEFKFENLIGYINNLVENENTKVIIITNEDKIDEPQYKVLKEKVIGNTFEFTLDIESAYDSILKENFSSFSSYLKFLEPKKNFIIEVFSKKSKNLRTLIFILTYFQNIHSAIENLFIEEKALLEYRDEIENSLLIFAIAISIAYKNGDITFRVKNHLENNTNTSFRTFFKTIVQSNLAITTDKSQNYDFYKMFIETFYKNTQYWYYDSIYGYITGGYVFNYKKLVQELNLEYHVTENEIKYQYKILNRLKYPDCYYLSQKEYKFLTREMLRYLDEGSYDLSVCLLIFHCAIRFQNPLGFRADILKKKIIKGMEKGKTSYTPIQFLEHTLSIEKGDVYAKEKKEISDFAIALNKRIVENARRTELNVLEKKFYDDLLIFQLNSLELPNMYATQPFFKYFDPNKFFLFFNNLSNDKRYQVILFFQNRYETMLHHDFDEELPFFQKLGTKVFKKNIVLKGKSINGEIYKWFGEEIEKIINKLSRQS